MLSFLKIYLTCKWFNTRSQQLMCPIGIWYDRAHRIWHIGHANWAPEFLICWDMGTDKLPITIFPEGPTWLKSWCTWSTHLRLQKLLNQATQPIWSKVYTMSVTYKLTLMVLIKNFTRGEIRTENPRCMNSLLYH